MSRNPWIKKPSVLFTSLPPSLFLSFLLLLLFIFGPALPTQSGGECVPTSLPLLQPAVDPICPSLSGGVGTGGGYGIVAPWVWGLSPLERVARPLPFCYRAQRGQQCSRKLGLLPHSSCGCLDGESNSFLSLHAVFVEQQDVDMHLHKKDLALNPCILCLEYPCTGCRTNPPGARWVRPSRP